VGASASGGNLVGVVVCTIGRVEPLSALLASLANQTSDDFVVSICAQGNFAEVEALVDRARGRLRVPISLIATERGLSRGRNQAVKALPAAVDWLVFPNDTSTYPPEAIERILSLPPSTGAACMAVRDPFGVKFDLPTDEPLDRRNVWAVISPGLIMRTSIFNDLHGFDESLGTGALTAWQSGEETDLLLRFMADAADSAFAWLPETMVGGVADAQGLSPLERRRKLRAYSRGYGRVLRRHQYGWGWGIRALVAGLTFGLRHGRQYSAVDGVPVLIGRIEGLLGRTFGDSDRAAVSR